MAKLAHHPVQCFVVFGQPGCNMAFQPFDVGAGADVVAVADRIRHNFYFDYLKRLCLRKVVKNFGIKRAVSVKAKIVAERYTPERLEKIGQLDERGASERLLRGTLDERGDQTETVPGIGLVAHGEFL